MTLVTVEEAIEDFEGDAANASLSRLNEVLNGQVTQACVAQSDFEPADDVVESFVARFGFGGDRKSAASCFEPCTQ